MDALTCFNRRVQENCTAGTYVVYIIRTFIIFCVLAFCACLRRRKKKKKKKKKKRRADSMCLDYSGIKNASRASFAVASKSVRAVYSKPTRLFLVSR